MAHDYDVALVTEPYVGARSVVSNINGVIIHQFSNGGRVKACIFVKDRLVSLGLAQHSSTNLCVISMKLSIRSITFASLYIEPDNDESSSLQALTTLLTGSKTSCVVGGDVNGRHFEWTSSADARGDQVMSVLSSSNFYVCNVGDEPTYSTSTHGRQRFSTIDITACSSDLVNNITEWRLNHHACTTSDHEAIDFVVTAGEPCHRRQRQSTFLFNTKEADWTKVITGLNEAFATSYLSTIDFSNLDVNDIDQAVADVTTLITDVCHNTLKRRGGTRPFNPWWTPELQELKQLVIRKHHTLQRIKRRHEDVTDAVNELHSVKKEYAKAIKKASHENFRTFCSRQGKENVWSMTNRLIKDAPSHRPPSTLKLEAGFTSTDDDTAKALLEHLFPDDEDVTDEQASLRQRMAGVPDTADDLAIVNDEVLECLKTMNPNKAPGPDHLTSDIVSVLVSEKVDFFTALLNHCLNIGHFPTPWKAAQVKILPKPGKDDYTDITSHRPIGLIPVFGKLFEKILIKRLTYTTSSAWNEYQFGFREQKSTTDALHTLVTKIKEAKANKEQVVGVSLDIKGAFDNASWPLLMERLRQTQCPRNVFQVLVNYHKDRRVTINVGEASATKTTSKGCVQGSVCGPTFWNLIADELLNINLPEGCHIQAFADDVMLLATGKTSDDVKTRTTDALDRIFTWGKHAKLTFSAAKTQAIAFTQRLRPSKFTVHGNTIKTTHEIKLLGVMIDHNLNFVSHAKYVLSKVTKTFRLLCKFVRPTWGVQPENVETIYRHVIEPIICYAAEIWGDAVRRKSVQRILRSFQRTYAIRAIRAFHTVSANAALALAQFTPLHLKILETLKIATVKRTMTYEALPDDMAQERRAPPLSQLHPAERVTITYASAENQEDADLHQSPTNIFTDGSKLETDETGAAFVIRHQSGRQEVRKLRLTKPCTVFQAEALAIDRALEWVMKRCNTDVTIYSDSRSSLDAIKERSNQHPLVVSIHEKLHQLRGRLSVKFVWVRAHVGIDGNEAADVAAKDAASQRRAAVYTSFPISYAKRHIKEETRKQWEREYLSAEQGSWTRRLLPTMKDVCRFRASTCCTFQTTQVLTNHGFHRQYLHRFKISLTASCPCGTGDQSLDHIFTECPGFEDARREYLGICHRRNLTPLALYSHLEHPDATGAFIDASITIVNSLKEFNDAEASSSSTS